MTARTWVDAPPGWKPGDPFPEGSTPIDAAGLNAMEEDIQAAADSAGGMTYPFDPNRARAIFVNGLTGDNANDGSSWGTAKKTIQAAVTALRFISGHVFVSGEIYNETVVVLGSGIRIIGMAGGVWKMPQIVAPTAGANCVEFRAERCHIENMRLRGHNGGSGVGSGWTGTALFLAGGNNTASGLIIDNDDDMADATYGGTGVSLGDGTERCRFSDFQISGLHLAVELRTEGTTSTFENFRLSQCRHELNMPGGTLAGGCLFMGWKSGQGGQREHVGGTDDFTHKVTNINGGGNTFINCDWSESHNIFHECSSSHNIFINCVIAPASRMDITGDYNTIIAYDVLGSMFVSGKHNKLEGIWPHLGNVTVTGVGNIVSNAAENQRSILGSGFVRAVTSDVTDGNRALVLARSLTVPGDVLPDVFEPALWLVGDDVPGSDGDPVTQWRDRSQASGTGDTTTGSQTIENVAVTSGKFKLGQFVRGPGIPVGAQITVMDPPNHTITITAQATATGSGVSIVAGRDALGQATAGSRPTVQVAELNGHRTVRWDSTPDDFLLGSVVIPYKQAIVVCKYAPAAFGGNVGLITSEDSNPDHPNQIALAGSSGGTVFINDSHYTTDYSLDNTGYAESAMAAPVNGAWGIVSISNPAGWASLIQLGNDRDNNRYWNGDIAEVILLTEVLAAPNTTALVRSLGTKYAHTVA